MQGMEVTGPSFVEAREAVSQAGEERKTYSAMAVSKAGCMTQLELEPVVKIPERGTQQYRLLMAMKHGKRLTVAKALLEHGCYALSQRVGELKRMGWPVKTRMITTAGGARVAEYSLE